jgi:hypothetical protein
MKHNLILIFLLLFSVSGITQTIYTTQEAKDHIGDSAYVKGVVSEIFTSDKGNIFISFDNKYPEHTFSVVLFKRNNIDITTISVGSIVTVSGLINSFNDKPQIIVKSQSQIVKVE